MATELISQINLALLNFKIHWIAPSPHHLSFQATNLTKRNVLNSTEKTIIKQRWMARLFYISLGDSSALSHFLEITGQFLSDFNFSFFQLF